MPVRVSARRRATVLLAAVALFGLAACQYADPNTTYPTNKPGKGGGGTYEKPESLFGGEGLDLFGGKSSTPRPGGGGIGVNSYLWRASLDTISFMPLASADPFGGVIITDWYTPPEVFRERFKVNVYILGRDLRADGVRAAVFRQRQDILGQWADAEVNQQTAIDLEDAILTRARQLRIAAVQ